MGMPQSQSQAAPRFRVAAIDLLERDVERQKRIARWKKAVRAVAAESARVNREFQTHSLLKRSRE